MKTGEFNLQPALTYKETMEDIHQLELVEVEAAYARESEILDRLSRLERQGHEDLERKHALGKIDVIALRVYFGDLQMLQTRIQQQMRLLEDLAEKTRLKREKLIEISKEKKALEKLKEKHESRVSRALIQAENRVMGDIATSQYYRRRVS